MVPPLKPIPWIEDWIEEQTGVIYSRLEKHYAKWLPRRTDDAVSRALGALARGAKGDDLLPPVTNAAQRETGEVRDVTSGSSSSEHAEEGNRTPKGVSPGDFESPASAVPPPRRGVARPVPGDSGGRDKARRTARKGGSLAGRPVLPGTGRIGRGTSQQLRVRRRHEFRAPGEPERSRAQAPLATRSAAMPRGGSAPPGLHHRGPPGASSDPPARPPALGPWKNRRGRRGAARERRRFRASLSPWPRLPCAHARLRVPTG